MALVLGNHRLRMRDDKPCLTAKLLLRFEVKHELSRLKDLRCVVCFDVRNLRDELFTLDVHSSSSWIAKPCAIDPRETCKAGNGGGVVGHILEYGVCMVG